MPAQRLSDKLSHRDIFLNCGKRDFVIAPELLRSELQRRAGLLHGGEHHAALVPEPPRSELHPAA